MTFEISKPPLYCILHTINMHIDTYTCRIQRHNEDERHSLLEKYTSHFIWKVVCERELETEQNCNILTPTLMAISVVSFSFSRADQPEAWGASLSGTCSHSSIFSPTGLVSKLVSKLTDFLSSPSYIIVPSPTQSLEWHVWSSSSGNNCHAVHRSFSSGASVYDCTTGFYHVPYCHPSPPTRSLSITGHRNVSLPQSLEWHVWPGRRSIYNNCKAVGKKKTAGKPLALQRSKNMSHSEANTRALCWGSTKWIR